VFRRLIHVQDDGGQVYFSLRKPIQQLFRCQPRSALIITQASHIVIELRDKPPLKMERLGIINGLSLFKRGVNL
jgi:hypothetical protein